MQWLDCFLCLAKDDNGGCVEHQECKLGYRALWVLQVEEHHAEVLIVKVEGWVSSMNLQPECRWRRLKSDGRMLKSQDWPKSDRWMLKSLKSEGRISTPKSECWNLKAEGRNSSLNSEVWWTNDEVRMSKPQVSALISEVWMMQAEDWMWCLNVMSECWSLKVKGRCLNDAGWSLEVDVWRSKADVWRPIPEGWRSIDEGRCLMLKAECWRSMSEDWLLNV